MSGKRVKRKAPEPPPVEKPSKDEYAIAKYMRDNVPCKKTKFLHHPVNYFTASKAVDVLLDSPWASGEKKKPILFTDRDSVVEYLDLMLRHKFFHRAKKIAISERDLRRKQLKKLKKKEEEEKKKKDPTKEGEESESETEEEEEGGAEEKERGAEKGEKSNAEETAGEKSAVEGETSPKAKKKKGDAEKPKRRIKLDMHLEQVFVDGSDAYVWIYDPIPTYYWLLGGLLVAAIVAVCLFPLWPSRVREYVYYLSLAAAGFLVFILALSVIRLIVFAIIWVVTMGRHHLWLLPNLTEDVGFFASFWPLYQYEYKGPKEETTKKKGKRKKKEKVSDNEEEARKPGERVVEQGEEGRSTAPEAAAAEQASETQPPAEQESEGAGSEGSQHSSTFELLDRDDST